MLSLSAALTEALTGLLVEPRQLQTPLRSIELPYSVVPVLPPVEQPYFVEPEPPPTTEPEAPQQVESVWLALYGDGFFIVEGRHGQQLYTRVGDFRINDQHELVTKDGLRLLGYVADDEGDLVPELAPLVVSHGPEISHETTTVTFLGVLNPSVAIGESTSTNFVVYDELGNEIPLNITAVLSAKNADSTDFLWTVNYAPMSGFVEELGSGVISFDRNGDLIWRAQPSLLVEQDAGAVSIELDFSQVKALGATDAHGNPISSLNPIQKGGFPPGSFQSFIITGVGEIQGQFTNGMQRLLGQLQLAAIANPHGLRKVGPDLYAVTSSSGEPRIGEPYSSAMGSVTHLPPGYIVTEEGYILREDESPPEHSSSTEPSPRGLRYPWQVRSVNLKLEGQELFIVEGSDGRSLYTRDGQFHLNAQQQLVTRDGLRVLGIGPDGGALGPLTIPLGQFESKATEIVQFIGSFDPRANVAITPGTLVSNVLGDGTFEIPDLSGTTIEVVPATAGQTGLDPGAYRYYFTYYDSANNTESQPVELDRWPSFVSHGQAIYISGLPQSSSDNPLQIRVYRNPGTHTSKLYRVAELPVGATSYLDRSSDTDIAGNPLVDWDEPPANESTKLVDVILKQPFYPHAGEYVSPFVPGELTYQSYRKRFSGEYLVGFRWIEKTLAITSETMVLDLLSFMEQVLEIDGSDSLPGSPGVFLVDGQIRIVSNLGEQNDVNIGLTGLRIRGEGEQHSTTLPLLFRSVENPDGPGVLTEFVVYDAQGEPIFARITTYLESRDTDSSTFRWIARSEHDQLPEGASTVLGNGLLVFNAKGQLVQGEIGQITLHPGGGEPVVVNLDFQGVAALRRTDAQGNPTSSLNIVFQDGFPPGALKGYSISETGEIVGRFSQSLEKTLGQLQLATFSRPFWLKPVGHRLLSPTRRSGQPEQVTPGDPGVSTITQEPPMIHRRHDFDRGVGHHGGRSHFRHLRSEKQPDERKPGQEFDPLEAVWSNFQRVFHR